MRVRLQGVLAMTSLPPAIGQCIAEPVSSVRTRNSSVAVHARTRVSASFRVRARARAFVAVKWWHRTFCAVHSRKAQEEEKTRIQMGTGERESWWVLVKFEQSDSEFVHIKCSLKLIAFSPVIVKQVQRIVWNNRYVMWRWVPRIVEQNVEFTRDLG